MTDEELILRFETGMIPEHSFHHSDHLRLAFAYLRQDSPLEALARFTTALKRYAASLGKAQLYHETITLAYFFLIHERMARCNAVEWGEFIARNSDLLAWKNGVLTHYYRAETLQSDLARNVFVFPDKW